MAKIMKICRKMHICEVNGSGHGATDKNQFLSCYDVSKSKETHGQTRGLSNLEMKHVGKLAIINWCVIKGC